MIHTPVLPNENAGREPEFLDRDASGIVAAALMAGYLRDRAQQNGNSSQKPSRTTSEATPAEVATLVLSVALKNTTATSAAIPAASGIEPATTSLDPILKKIGSSSPPNPMRWTAAGVISSTTDSATAQSPAQWMYLNRAGSSSKAFVSVATSWKPSKACAPGMMTRASVSICSIFDVNGV